MSEPTPSPENKRFSISVSEDHQEKLSTISKRFKLSQGDVIECLVDLFSEETHAAALVARRIAKVSKRESSKRVRRKIANAIKSDPDALAKIEALLAGDGA